MKKLSDLRVKLFADGADKAQIAKWHAHPLVRGFTTNPTLMRSAGVKDYESFAREILDIVKDRPISFEVFADDFSDDVMAPGQRGIVRAAAFAALVPERCTTTRQV